MELSRIRARKVLNSGAQWTVQAELWLNNGQRFLASVPAGASKGQREAVSLPAGQAVENINYVIGPAILSSISSSIGGDLCSIDKILLDLDGTKNKSRLGANAMLAVSMASCRAMAAAADLPLYQYINKIGPGELKIENWKLGIGDFTLPQPSILGLEGGLHGGSGLAIQEFMFIPLHPAFLGLSQKIEAGVEVYQALKEILKAEFGSGAGNVGLEGGFSPALEDTGHALSLVMRAIKESGYKDQMAVGLDCAASEFFWGGKYDFEGKKRTAPELADFYNQLLEDYPIMFLEDPFDEDDWQAWREMESGIKNKGSGVFLVGDDLTTTNPDLIKKARKEKACEAVVIKPNQIGTITETLEAVALAKKFGWRTIVSHRAGDTCDDFIADLAVGVRADFVKFGAPARGERTSKYNRLLQIEGEL